MTGLVEQLGALGVFLLMVPESACIPVPSELTLLFSGVAVARGWMSFPVAVVAATAGNLVGSMIAYSLGATGVWRRVPGLRAVLEHWSGLIERHGTRAVFVARLLPLARSFVSLPAGAARVRLAPFLVLSAAGCAAWAIAFIAAGAVSSDAWTAVNGVVGRVLLVVGAVVLAASLFGRRRP